jgi:hypothetical protein
MLLVLLACSLSQDPPVAVQPPPPAPAAAPPPATPAPAAPAAPAPDPALAQRLLDAEGAPSEEGEDPATPPPGRLEAIQAFVATHPDLAANQEVVIDYIQGRDAAVEDALAAVLKDLGAAPAQVTVGGNDPGAVVILQWGYDTSEDWAWFVDRIKRSLDAAKVPYVETEPLQRRVSVTVAGGAPETVDLSPLAALPTVGYAVIPKGRAPVWVAHAMPGDVVAALGRALGREIPLAEGE